MNILLNKFRKIATKNRNQLTSEQIKFWNENGYLLLKNAISANECESIDNQVTNQWAHPKDNDHLIDILSGPLAGKEIRVKDAPAAIRNESYKLNNLFARTKEIREVALNPTIKSALCELLNGEPLICNTLNFERGSQQPYHLDTWYMPPPIEGKMIAAIIALDDIGPHNGPFIYYPGSHAIKPYYFSNGRLNLVAEEATQCTDYLNKEIAKRGLVPTELKCNAGDVLLWHANLFHGGAAINDMSLTRKSLVVHYWRKKDINPANVRNDRGIAYLGHTLRGEIEY